MDIQTIYINVNMAEMDYYLKLLSPFILHPNIKMLAIAYSLKNITCVNKDIIALNQSHLAKIITLNFSFHIHA